MTDQVSKPYIFHDEPATGNLALDFGNYAHVISLIIQESDPQFTIGILGPWGSGKTTLLNKIECILRKKRCTTLQFNAWRYEQESEHSKIPLMLEIINSLTSVAKKGQGNNKSKKGKKIADATLRAKKYLSSWDVHGVTIDIMGVGSIDANRNQNEEKFVEKTKPPVQKGLEIINKLIQTMDGPNQELKMVIMIDDLDRCSPDKVLQIFESIKIFFNIKGIVFVLGLSNEIIESAIKEKYGHFDKFSGKRYLEKIIQLPFAIPIWNIQDVRKYINRLVMQHPDPAYQQIFKKNINLIVGATKQNPREVKRYLNNFILSKYLNRDNSDLEDGKMLILSALFMRWGWFLDAFWDDLDMSRVKSLIKHGKDSKPEPGSIEERIMSDMPLQQFLRNEGSVILQMTKKEIQEYRRSSPKFLAAFGINIMDFDPN